MRLLLLLLYFFTGPSVPKVILMNWQTNQKVMILNNYTDLATKYAAMAKPNIQIMQVIYLCIMYLFIWVRVYQSVFLKITQLKLVKP